MNAEAPAETPRKRRSAVYADIEFATALAEALANHQPRAALAWTPSCAMATLAFAAGIVLGHVGETGDMGDYAKSMTGFMEMGRIKVGGGVWGRA